MLAILVLAAWFPISLEASAGIVLPGTSSTDTPSVCWEPAALIPVAAGWEAVVSFPMWKLSNFDPSSGIPDYAGRLPQVQYDWHQSYSEKSICFQAGVRRNLGPLFLQAACGVIDRTLSLSYDGGDFDAFVNTDTYSQTSFLGSLSVIVPAGDRAILSAGVRTFDSEVLFTLGTGLRLSSLPGGGE